MDVNCKYPSSSVLQNHIRMITVITSAILTRPTVSLISTTLPLSLRASLWCHRILGGTGTDRHSLPFTRTTRDTLQCDIGNDRDHFLQIRLTKITVNSVFKVPHGHDKQELPACRKKGPQLKRMRMNREV